MVLKKMHTFSISLHFIIFQVIANEYNLLIADRTED